MERAARSPRSQAACLGLLVAFLYSCATIQDPPGGPPDYDPPIVLSIIPDSGSVVEGFDDDLEIRFNEVIDERSGSGLENLTLLSPRPEEIDVSWKRSRITVKPKGGWRDSVIYHFKLLPGIADLTNNRLDTGRTVVFSTGGEIPDTRIEGTAINWESGRAAQNALIEAIKLPDSLVYFDRADSVGGFEIRYLTPGSYLLLATVDENNNNLREYREFFDSMTVTLDTAVSQVLWAFAHDTVGPRISSVADLDSVTIQVDFFQKLLPGMPGDSAVQVYGLPDTTLLGAVAIWNQPTYDSVRIVEAVADSIRQAAIADSIRAAEEAADTAVVDTTLADSLMTDVPPTEPAADVEAITDTVQEELGEIADSAGQFLEDSAAADTSLVDLLLMERPQLSESWYVRMASSLVPGARYLIVAIAENLSGAIEESQSLLIIPEPVDTVAAAADTT